MKEKRLITVYIIIYLTALIKTTVCRVCKQQQIASGTKVLLLIKKTLKLVKGGADDEI